MNNITKRLKKQKYRLFYILILFLVQAALAIGSVVTEGYFYFILWIPVAIRLVIELIKWPKEQKKIHKKMKI